MSKPEVLERHDASRVDEGRDRTRLGDGGHVEGAALGPDLELLLEVADRLDLDLYSASALISSSKISW